MACTDSYEKQSDNRRVFKRLTNNVKSACSMKTIQKKLPITYWLPKYELSYMVPDIIAGVTVGLTAIPQGIAYAVVAGLTPEYGLYAGMMSGFVYLIFGSCKEITIGPTAILAALIGTYVTNYSTDFAFLGGLLNGVIILAMGILHLGFLVEFISEPVISGFTTGAALQIASAQLRSMFGLVGPSGNNFGKSLECFFENITTVKLWDTVLSFSTIAMLILLQQVGKGCKQNDTFVRSARWFIALSRNAIVVIIGIVITYTIKATSGNEPIAIIGNIGSGIPSFNVPPTTTVVDNKSVDLNDMLKIFGPQFITIPLVAILSHVSVSKAFSGGVRVDATQEMIALGFCNIIGSFFGGMPITGSFTRTALNSASGVKSQAGGIVTSGLLIVALTLLTSTFYYIPRATLAGVIMTAMFSMIDYSLIVKLWRKSKKELLILILTMLSSMFVGLEIGIIVGVLLDAVLLMYVTARPKLNVRTVRSGEEEACVITLSENVAYCAADHVRRIILKASRDPNLQIIVDATKLKQMDTTVALNLIAVIKELGKTSTHIYFLNMKANFQNLCIELDKKIVNTFVTAKDVEECLVKCSAYA